MQELILTLDITPIPKQSVRQVFSGGKSIFYQDSKYRRYSKEIQRQVTQQLPAGFTLFDSALEIEVLYSFGMLKGHRKKDREFMERGGMILKTTKPDVTDNLNKALFDALEGLIYDNDSKIAMFSSMKVYSRTSQIIVKIKSIPDLYVNNW